MKHTALLLLLIALPTFAQTPAAPRPAFEVVSIKPYTDPGPGPHLAGFGYVPGSPRMDMTGVTFKMLMSYAYAARDFQIIGGPAWIDSDQYDIQAKAEDGTVPAPVAMRNPNVPDPLALRVQSMLDDRFQLKMHRETRDLPVYELVVAKGGSKLQLSADQGQPGSPARPGRLFTRRSTSGWSLEAIGIPLPDLISALSEYIGRPIVDRSDLKAALYDAKLQWTHNGEAGPVSPAPDSEELSIFTALQEQIGLRLVSAKGPVEVFVIDTVQKPSAN